MGIVGRISQLQGGVSPPRRPPSARHGLDVPSFDVLAALRRAGAPYQLTPTALMRTALVTPGALTPRLDRLGGKGLITPGRSEADGGALVVTPPHPRRAAPGAPPPPPPPTERTLPARGPPG